MKAIEIRPYTKEDLPPIDALEARIQPYRPEGEAEVAAIYSRAVHAQESKDPRWIAFHVYPIQTIKELLIS